MDTTFRPAWWMKNRHAQTILPRFFRPRLALDYSIEKLETPDDDFLELAWAEQQQQDAPLAIVLHGLEGNIDSFYAKGMMKALYQQGFAAVLMHFRNCSREPNRQPRAYHSGETQDLSFFIDTLKQRWPTRPLFAVGFSLGGNVLAKYLGEQGKHSRLAAAAVVSAPFDLSSSCQVIRKSFGKLYQKYLLDKMKVSMSRKLPAIRSMLPLGESEINNINDLWQFDEQVTAPLHGFDGAEDYYRRASAGPFLQHIATPTLIIHAEDDPMLSSRAVPRPEQVSASVELRVSQNGGHVGFIGGRNPLRPVFWLEHAVPRFFTDRLKAL